MHFHSKRLERRWTPLSSGVGVKSHLKRLGIRIIVRYNNFNTLYSREGSTSVPFPPPLIPDLSFQISSLGELRARF